MILRSLLGKTTNKEKQLKNYLKNVLGISPRKLYIYLVALRHRSATGGNSLLNSAESNERLEYLGDAILSAVIAKYLFLKFPLKGEGFLTEMRSKMVSREMLNKISYKLMLHDQIDFNNKKGTISSSSGGNALEALIGAIYLDKGFEKTEKFVLQKVISRYMDMQELETKEVNFKSRIIELGQKEKVSVNFEIINHGGRKDNNIYEIALIYNQISVSTGKGKTKKAAEQEACEKYLKHLGYL